MIGSIGFKKLKIQCIIGVNPEERITEQYIYVDLKVKADFTNCADTDKFSDTVDYVRLSEICIDFAQIRKYQLLEKYASDVLKYLIAEFPVVSAWIRIEKPQAILSAECSYVELEVKR